MKNITTHPRLWRAINPTFLSHRLAFVKNHLFFDDIFWNRKDSNLQGLDMALLCDTILQFKQFASQINMTENIYLCAAKLGNLMNTSPRNKLCPSINTKWGSIAPDGEKLWKDMEKWLDIVLTSPPNIRKAIQWELLLTLEGLMPWEQYNGFLTKLLWNLARYSWQLPLAMIKADNSGAYTKELIIYSDKLITKQLLSTK